jgi:hypothetical protein
MLGGAKLARYLQNARPEMRSKFAYYMCHIAMDRYEDLLLMCDAKR